MTISTILDRIRNARWRDALIAAENYRHLVSEVAEGTEVDANDAASVIERAGKSDADFKRAVDQMMIGRLREAEMIARYATATRKLFQAEAHLRASLARLNAVLATLRPVFDECDGTARPIGAGVHERCCE